MEAQRVDAPPANDVGLESLRFLKSTDPPLWLTPNPSLSQATRIASQHLFSILNSFSPKCPFDHLLVDGFDGEQIWQQIDLQTQPVLASVRRDLKRFEKNPQEISNLKVCVENEKKIRQEMVKGLAEENDGFDDVMEGSDDDDEEEEDDDEDDYGVDGEGEDIKEEDDDEDDTEERDGKESDDEDEREGEGGGIEDGFFKIKELEEFMEGDEVREYGLENNTITKKKKKQRDKEDEEYDDDEEEEDDELGYFGLGDEEDEDDSKLEKVRYQDFFGTGGKNPGRRKSKVTDGSEDSDSDDSEEDKISENLSTHQKQLMKLQSEIEQMEKANLEPKTWTMQGEVTAAKRPKNSALEADLDFEHNVRPAPVITEEVTATLEEMIQKRILEGRFDDVQKAPKRPTKAPREIKDLDENKSKKGLGEIYEQEYVEKTNLATVPESFSDETKKEASILFKKLCLKLDALSHFHFAPKPVIDDMTIQANVPALAMEEIAPVAISDAAMLAPEEVFDGKGDIKEAAELTQSDRKRRRANKKRRYKAMVTKRDAKKARNTKISNPSEGK